MPKLSQSLPKYRKHRKSGQAIVTIGGKDFYLGPHGTKASRLQYDRIIAEWLTAGRPARHPSVTADAELPTVAELINGYWSYAVKYYQKDGVSTGTAERLKPLLRMVKDLYGDVLITEFRPLSLETIQQKLIEQGYSRVYINMHTARIKRMFRWGVKAELVPPDIQQRLNAVPGLRKGRTEAAEPDPIEPVAPEIVEATIPHLPPVVQDMVRFQELTGARPTEVCLIRPGDIDRSGEVWRYVPSKHKTEHHGRSRVVFIGPRAQAVLRPYLLRADTAYCFQPAESERKRNAQRRENRQSPMTPSQAARKPKRKRQRAPSERYDKNSYANAIRRAVKLANRERVRLGEEALPHWAPNRLRHSAATEIRRRYGLEAAQVILGHSKADITQVYAERDYAKAEQVMREVG